MAITWGAASGYMRVGVDLSYSGSPASGAVTVTAKLIIQSVQYGHDWTYPIYWSGSGGSGSQQVTFYSPWNTTTTKTVKTWTFSAATQYGKTTTVTVSSSLGPIWNKGNPSVTARLSVPARPYAAPAAPTNVNVKRTSATQAVLSWSIASTTSAPVLAQGIERWDAQSKTWNRVSTVGGSIRSWTDVSLTANNAYTYRVWGDSGNAAGSKTQAAQYVTSTIAAPTSVNAVKQSNGNISVSWATAYPGGGTYDVYDNGTRVATATSATTFTHVSPSALVTHSYTVTQSDNGVTSPQSASSNTVQLLAAPAAPTFKSGSGSYSVGDITLSWVHNPVDGSAQTAANVRYRLVGASSWTTATTTTAQSYTASFTAGSYEWQVQTKGLHADYSPWSEVWSFGVGSVPTVAITSPTAGGVVPTSRVPVTWTYTQTENSVLKSSQIQLISGTDVIEDVTVVGNVLTKTLGTRLNNGGSYRVKVRSLAANGLWSAWVTQSFTVAFPAPPTPQVTVTFDYEKLQAKVSVVNPTATTGQANAVRNTVQRSVDGGVSWATLADTRLNLITYDDKALTHGDTLYRVYATSNDDVDSTQVIVTMNVPLDSAHLHTPDTVRGCATREVFFAVGDHSSWFPSPAVGMTANNTSWGAVTQLTNGFNTVVGSVYASRTYELSWTHLTRAQAETFRHLFLTAGNKPVFFLDPFAGDNVLSQIGGLPVLHIDTMSPIAWSSIGDLRAERTGESSVIFSDITEGSVKYTERVVIPKGKYAVVYVAGDGSVFSGFEVDNLKIPTNVVEPFDGPRTLDIVFNPVIGTRVDYAVVKVLPLYEQIPNSVDFSYPAGGGNMRVVPGSAILTPVNNALGIYSASLSLTEVWPW